MIRGIRSEFANDVEFHIKISDRFFMPRRGDFNYMYQQYNNKIFGKSDMTSICDILKTRVNQLKIENSSYIFCLQEFNQVENDAFILILVTPLMLRIHEKLKSSSEMVFVDSTGGLEEYNLRFFLMVTHSPVGALPLAFIITSDETYETVVQAFEMLKSVLPSSSFFGRSHEGPMIFMTDNCSELREALHSVWPSATLLLCVFHLLQQVWRWLYDKKHGIVFAERQGIMMAFKRLVYTTESEELLEERYEEFKDMDDVTKYKNLVNYLDDVFELRFAWCLFYRNHLPIRGHNTNNLVEAQFLVIKDNILNRTKEININGVVDKVTSNLEDHYKTKLINVANGKFDGIYSRQFKGLSKQKSNDLGFQLPKFEKQVELVKRIRKVDHHLYYMPSCSDNTKAYLVDMNSCICECEVGHSGAPCKHQLMIWIHLLKKSDNFLPYLTAEERKNYSYIAIGEYLPNNYYEGLHKEIDFSENADMEISSDNTEIVANEILTARKCEQVKSSRRLVETFDKNEVLEQLADTNAILVQMVNSTENRDLLRGLLTFCDRVKKYHKQDSRISSAFHSFASTSTTSLRITASASLKRAKKGKIFVQPESLKRRKSKNGSKRPVVKGMVVKRNPFQLSQVRKKRSHIFSENVANNEAISHKAGRTMATKTKFLSKSK